MTAKCRPLEDCTHADGVLLPWKPAHDTPPHPSAITLEGGSRTALAMVIYRQNTYSGSAVFAQICALNTPHCVLAAYRLKGATP